MHTVSALAIWKKYLMIKHDKYLGGIAMLESRQDNYYGFDVTMYRVSDHLWISNIMPNAQYLVNQFNYDKMIWTQTTYTTDEIEQLFNISHKVIK